MQKYSSSLTFLFILLVLPLSIFAQQVIQLNSDGTLDKSVVDYKKVNYFYGSNGLGGVGYTDEEKNIVDNFYHTGKAQEFIEAECAKDPGLCQGVGTERNNLAEIAAKMYGVVVQGALGGKVDYGAKASDTPKAGASKTDTASTSKKSVKKEDTEGTDYCSYGAMGTEMIALATQSTNHENIMSVPMNEENQQKETLYKVKRVHEARADTSKVQEVGWGVTAGCYVALAAYGGVTGDLMTTAKSVGPRLAASGFLFSYFKDITKEEQARADQIQAIIDQMPKTGDCNPVSERSCYCGEETSKNDPNYLKYCIPQEYQNYLNDEASRISCLDDNMKDDPECSCLATNTCYDQKYSEMIHSIPNSKAISAQILEPYAHLTQGQLTAGDLAAMDTLNQNAVRTKLNELNKNLPQKKIVLSNKENAMARELNKTMPAHMAQLLASTKLPASVKGKVAQFQHSNLSSYGNNATNRVLTSGGKGTLKNRHTSKKSNKLSSRFNKKKKAPAASKVLRFGKRATEKAQITRKKDTPIFDIISSRYKVTGWPIFLE